MKCATQRNRHPRTDPPTVDKLAIEIVEADRSLTLEAAHIKAHRPLSYADAFVVALALQKGAEVVTGDPEFRQAEEQVAIRWLPRE